MEISSSTYIGRPEQAPKRPKIERSGEQSDTPVNPARGSRDSGLLKSTEDESVLRQARQFNQQAGYDKPDEKGSQAVTEYLSLEKERRRESLREMLGVDLYA